MKTGAVIVAAGMSTRMKQFKQMMKIGNLTMAERVIMSFRKAGIDDIVVVIGYRGDELKEALAYLNPVFIENKDYEHTQMFESAKLGLEHFLEGYDKALFCPVDVTAFSIKTLEQVIKCKSEIAVPRCKGRNGHPIAIKSSLIPGILSYQGERGLKGAMEASGVPIDYIEVDDMGSLMDADTVEDYERIVQFYNKP